MVRGRKKSIENQIAEKIAEKIASRGEKQEDPNEGIKKRKLQLEVLKGMRKDAEEEEKKKEFAEKEFDDLYQNFTSRSGVWDRTRTEEVRKLKKFIYLQYVGTLQHLRSYGILHPTGFMHVEYDSTPVAVRISRSGVFGKRHHFMDKSASVLNSVMQLRTKIASTDLDKLSNSNPTRPNSKSYCVLDLPTPVQTFASLDLCHNNKAGPGVGMGGSEVDNEGEDEDIEEDPIELMEKGFTLMSAIEPTLAAYVKAYLHGCWPGARPQSAAMCRIRDSSLPLLINIAVDWASDCQNSLFYLIRRWSTSSVFSGVVIFWVNRCMAHVYSGVAEQSATPLILASGLEHKAWCTAFWKSAMAIKQNYAKITARILSTKFLVAQAEETMRDSAEYRTWETLINVVTIGEDEKIAETLRSLSRLMFWWGPTPGIVYYFNNSENRTENKFHLGDAEEDIQNSIRKAIAWCHSGFIAPSWTRWLTPSGAARRWTLARSLSKVFQPLANKKKQHVKDGEYVDMVAITTDPGLSCSVASIILAASPADRALKKMIANNQKDGDSLESWQEPNNVFIEQSQHMWDKVSHSWYRNFLLQFLKYVHGEIPKEERENCAKKFSYGTAIGVLCSHVTQSHLANNRAKAWLTKLTKVLDEDIPTPEKVKKVEKYLEESQEFDGCGDPRIYALTTWKRGVFPADGARFLAALEEKVRQVFAGREHAQQVKCLGFWTVLAFSSFNSLVFFYEQEFDVCL